MGQSKAAQTPCAGAGGAITDEASSVGACQLRQIWENDPFFLEFTACANSGLDNIAHFSCFMHIDFQSTKLECSHLSSKGKSIRNPVVLSFEEKEERSAIAFFF